MFYLILLTAVHCSHAFSHEIKRRTVIGSLLSTPPILLTAPSVVTAVPTNSNLPPGIQGAGGSITRVEGMGSGFDITTSTTKKGIDVIYPASMVGIWKCRRMVTSVEGDTGQAELAWRNLGGNGSIQSIESFVTRFILPPLELNVQTGYTFDEADYPGVVLDRGYDIDSRNQNQCKAAWDIDAPDVLVYEKDGGTVEVAVVQRKIELPSENGFGFNELYRITSSAGGIFGENKVQRAVRVQRRYRRALDENGNRIVEGLEIMKTYRVLDGIAGVEMPTSTTKSQIKFIRN